MKIGGSFISSFDYNTGKLYPQNIICRNLHDIHENIRNFENAHKNLPNSNRIMKINYMRPEICIKPLIIYDNERDVRNMFIDIKFNHDGTYDAPGKYY